MALLSLLAVPQGAEGSAESTRREIFELLETLLDLIQQSNHAGGLSTELHADLLTLAQELLPVYTATLSGSDKALLRSLLLLNKLLSEDHPDSGGSAAPMSFLERIG